MKIFIIVLGFILFAKCFLFWLWLWQLKEYHFGRFKAHFETQKWKKIISSFWRIKLPKFTKKTITILFFGILLVSLILFCISPFENSAFYISLLIILILSPAISSLLILFFQIPADILRNKILKRAQQKRAKVDELRSSSPSLGLPHAPRLVFEDLLVIGITGSYGKTSTKEFLADILSKKFKVLKTKKHINAEIGIAQAILNELTREHEIFIAEIGAYEKGKIKQVCEILQPKIGILTGINEQHLSTFGSLENIIEAKFELIESLPEDGIAFFNARNKYCVELYEKTKIRKFLYGKKAIFLGEENILGAMAVAKELGMTEEEISRATGKIKNKFGGIQIKKGINGLNIIDATYSANPDGVIAHLEYLKTFPGKKVIVMPCLIELGKASAQVHKRIGEKIGEVCDLAIITTKDRFKEIKDGAGDRAVFMEDPKAILEKIKNFTKEGDLVLLESRVPDFLIKQLIL